ncbi:TonB-dependent receptor plug domain-containing protein [Campylobacter mucosalis]|uniref:TonB-dependent receptor plug domain-containing protein n=1 Tax=Campylobacter mucosalis TaxID=202 RepID=UPI001B8CC7BA|nr:TonB-dependent receptor plug domain-containing protein [Campylobacter mucosalis]
MKNLSTVVVIYSLLGLTQNINANEQTINFEEIEVVAKEEQGVKDRKIGEIKKTAKELSKQQVSDTKDMVKYETGVSVVESGRFGASGYSIRGVDENRVAIQIDGLNQAQTLSSQGFKEIFEGYGNFNNTRNSVEIENIKQANITKGADSIKTGSGALGGSVMFETKDAKDYLIDKDWHYSFKVGHNSANDERLHAHTLAARFKWFDILVIKTDRDGRELKNFGYSNFDDSIRGREREKADPYNITKEGTLVKFGFTPHEEHRFSFTNDKYRVNHKGSDYSYTLYPPSSGSGFAFKPRRGERYTDDLSERLNQSFAYENFTQTPFWDSFKITYSHQKIKQRARTEEYCRGDCADIANPLGLKLDGAKTIDKNGNDFKITKEVPSGASASFTHLTDSNGNKYLTGFTTPNAKTYAIDCSVFDCSGSINLYNTDSIDKTTKEAEKVILDLAQTTQNFNSINGKTYIFDIANDTYNGKTYKVIKAQNQFKNWLGTVTKQPVTDFVAILPQGKGFLSRDWKERDLDTKTKQLNLDFEKELEFLNTQHSLKYGAIYSKTTKSMINRGGYDASNSKWWANTYKPDCNGADKWDELRCPRVSPETSFLIPVETKNNAFYLSESMQINDYIGVDLAYRYDKVKHNPIYIPGKTPAIPDDMVKGIFVPLVNVPPKPNWWDSKYHGGRTDPKF